MLGIIIIIDILQLCRRYDRYISALSRGSIPGKFYDSHHSVQNKTGEVLEGPPNSVLKEGNYQWEFFQQSFLPANLPTYRAASRERRERRHNYRFETFQRANKSALAAPFKDVCHSNVDTR